MCITAIRIMPSEPQISSQNIKYDDVNVKFVLNKTDFHYIVRDIHC